MKRIQRNRYARTERRRSGSATGFFDGVVRRARPIVWSSLVIVGSCFAGLFLLEKDTRNKAYMSADHPAYRALDALEEDFGLSDGVVVAVVSPAGEDVFDPATLSLVDWITREVRRVDGVDPERVKSLATVRSIDGDTEGLRIERFYEGAVADASQAERVRRAVLETELYLDKLVSRDGRATVVHAELLDEDDGAAVYQELLRIAARAPGDSDAAIHVAGLGAYNALIGDYVDADAARLNPVTALLIVGMLFLAFRTWRGVWLPMMVAAGSVFVAMGSMGACGVPVFGITSSMSIILIAIAVCDSIHIMSEYYAAVAVGPDRPAREIVVETLVTMWRPVVITSVTSIAGFLALSFASDMPPMQAYGVFASVGVLAALLLSTLTLPALLSLLPVSPSALFAAPGRSAGSMDPAGRLATALGRLVVRRAGTLLVVSLACVVVGIAGATRIEVEEDSLKYLAMGEPLRDAEERINEHLGGISSLDVVFVSDEPEGILQPEQLERMAAVQAGLEGHPGVAGTFSVVDFIKQMHQAMNDGDPAFYRIPPDADWVAQYLLLYTASSSPGELDDVIDASYAKANLRVALRDVRWSTARDVKRHAQALLAGDLDSRGSAAHLSGWANVSSHLRDGVEESSIKGAFLAAVAVLVAAIACFASIRRGLTAFLPVAVALLMQFALMGLGGIWLSLITSMGSALAIGLSIDFGIHAVDRLQQTPRGVGLEAAIADFYAHTGRALVFNFAALVFGFGVLTTSLLPAMREFGAVLVVCVASGFLASMVLLPALTLVLGRASERAASGSDLETWIDQSV